MIGHFLKCVVVLTGFVFLEVKGCSFQGSRSLFCLVWEQEQTFKFYEVEMDLESLVRA